MSNNDAAHITMPLRYPAWPEYENFRSPLARDLCWLLSSDFDLPMPSSPYPPFSATDSDNVTRWLYEVDEKATANPAMNLPSRRLGHYFEDLVAYYLSHFPGNCVSNLQRNLPLRQSLADNKGVRTLGELDFLFEQDGQIQHLEVAVKFYLGVGEEPLRRWVGPNSKDRLDIKWRRMLTHQLPLAKHFSGYRNIQSRYWLKGLLFSHWRNYNSTDDRPLFHWLHASDAEEYLQRYDGHWQWLQKRHWLGACREDQATLSTEPLLLQLKQHFTHAAYGVMLINRSALGQHRCFIVADHWPSQGPSCLQDQCN